MELAAWVVTAWFGWMFLKTLTIVGDDVVLKMCSFVLNMLIWRQDRAKVSCIKHFREHL